MRTQQPPDASRRDVPGGHLPDRDGMAGACGFPGRGLCCPDDPLDLVLQLFPADRAPSSLAALGIGGGGEPPCQHQKPQPLAEGAYGGGGGAWDSWGLSSFVLDGLGLEEIDVDMFFADDALDGGGGGEGTEGNLVYDCDPTTGAKPKPPAHMAAAAAAGGGGPVHVHTRGALGGGVVPSDASPPPAPLPAGAFPLQPYDACRAFDAAVFSHASLPPPPPPPATAPPMPAACGGAPPVFVTNNSAPPLPPLMPPAAPAPMPAGAAPPVVVTNNGAPPLPALMPAALPRMPPAAPAPMPLAVGLHACGALPGIVSHGALPAPPPPLMAPMPGRALHPNAAALAGVYSSNNAPAHAPPSATPSSSLPSRASSGSGRCPSSTATSEPEFLQPRHVWVVPRKQRSPPTANRRKRPWVLDFPLHALPPIALPPVNPGGDDNDDDNADGSKNRNAALPVALAPPPGNTSGDDIAAPAGGGGGVRRRRPAPRQRNRQAQRVCSHCHSPETPQWRAGPDGPGTLCNACGIRYAANRLLPEYRPSTAPSFRSGLHSNRHRKMMKLREQMMMAKEEKPSSEQPIEDGTKKDDGGFMGACAYISAAGL